eukprot:COSAG04_NODE_27475_length_282_cov_1.404372_1_plen_73_part_10
MPAACLDLRLFLAALRRSHRCAGQLVANIKALEEKYGQKAYAGQWIHEGMAYFDASLHFEDKAEAERVTPTAH